MISQNFTILLQILSAIFFILSLKYLSSPKFAMQGISSCVLGMLCAILSILLGPFIYDIYKKILVSLVILSGGCLGVVIAYKVKMTAIPQLVAGFHSFVGLVAVLIASIIYSDIFLKNTASFVHLLELIIGLFVGAVTFTGSIIALGKLQGFIVSKMIVFRGQKYFMIAFFVINIFMILGFCLSDNLFLFIYILCAGLLSGILLVLPVGGADMPVIVSMLNSYSGWACVGIGFTLGNHLLIITGALIGASGAILSSIMCRAMNRSLFNVVFKAFIALSPMDKNINADDIVEKRPNIAYPQDVAAMLVNAGNVIIVPGYGMAVAQSQYIIKSLYNLLTKKSILVKFAIHPVAGRMPGHMNVLLAEANIDYENMFELDEINADFQTTDLVLVVGANDITNPAAKNNPNSPIYGMPILDVESAKTIVFIKRSLAQGYSQIENELFFKDNSLMLFGNAKKVLEDVVKEVENF